MKFARSRWFFAMHRYLDLVSGNLHSKAVIVRIGGESIRVFGARA
jgi:hypothetical protein